MHSSRAAPRPPSAARVSAGDANHLLSECYALFEARLLEMATSSLELAHDLFESHSHVPDGEVAAFLNKVTHSALWLGDLFARASRKRAPLPSLVIQLDFILERIRTRA